MNSLNDKIEKLNWGHVFGFSLQEVTLYHFNLSESNQALKTLDLKNTVLFNDYIFNTLKNVEARAGIGGYGENRVIYRRSEHYEGVESRSVHLGIDIWIEAETPVYSPGPAIIHSFADNKGFGNYGPTLILEHHLNNQTFYTLYGHLSRASLKNYYIGNKVAQGERIGKVGDFPENGDWPPHLHFQVILDLDGWFGDFPGVCAPSEKLKYLSICPDPEVILKTTKPVK
jgi:murein DD-endopeptidase MepM/ murein hydrolase activator NlpD